MARISETVHKSSLALANNDETVYVAVEKDVDKSIVTLTWALNYFRGKKFCIFHVHQLAKVIALIGGNSPGSSLEEHEVRTIRELDTKMVEKILDDYIFMCEQSGEYAEKLHIEMDDIGEGIVELVYQHSIKKLVIGAAADKHYSGGMKNIKSKKAMYVRDNVPPSCQIWFICSGNLIHSGKGGLDGAADEDRYASLQSISFSEMGGSHPSTSASGSSNLRCCDESESELEVLELPRFLELEQLSSSHELEGSSDDQLLDQLEQAQEEAGKWRREANEEANRREKAEKAVIEATRKVRALEGSYIEELRHRKEIEEVFAKEKEKYENMKRQWDEERLIALDQRVLMENQVSNYECRMKELDEERLIALDQRVLMENQVSNYECRMKELDEQAPEEAGKWRREANEEANRREKAEKAVIEATRKVRALEGSYIEELRHRKEIEEVFVKEKEKYENMKRQWDEERLIALDQRVLMENQVSNYECRMKELDEERLIALDQRVLMENQVSNYECRMKELDEQAQEEAGKWRREANEEANRREKAEKAVIEATRKVRALEGSYIEELRHRKEIEEVFAKEKEKYENMKRQWDEERLNALDQRVLMENQVSNYECRMKELDEERLIALDQRVLMENQVSNYECRMKELDEQAQEEAGKWRREANEEANRREKAEKAVIEATRKVRALEGSYIEELRHRKEIEEVFAKEKEKYENMKRQWDEERLIALDQRVLMENQVSNYECRMKELDEQAQEEAGKWRREANEEANRREKAEKAVIEATRKVRALEGSYIEELRHRKEIEEVFAKEKEKYENMKRQWDEERLIALDQRVLLENQVSNYECRMKELDEERLIALDQRVLMENQVSNYECRMKELDEERLIVLDQRVLLESQVSNNEYRMKELDGERLTAIDQKVLLESQISNYEYRMKELDLLTRQSEASSSSSMINTQQFFSLFSLSEIHEATSSFDQSLLIWEHGYGTMYKGTLRYTPVAIKMLNPDSFRGTSVFQEEVDVLSKFRHPNLITLIGVCPEEYGLIYEYLPNGSLRDRLSCKDSTPPLSWQTRISIATELCSALIFLHSSNPHSIVHGDLKAENIFLDAGFVSKLSGFGVSNHPEFLETGELSPKSDIYSFGIIILQLLTGKSRANIVETMPQILDMGNLNALLDSSAGDWPLVQAQQVAHLALRCCDSDPSNRPDLVSEVWRVLKPLSTSGEASSSFGMDSEEDRQSPSYFICPISQEVMQDPVVAADGHTYEEEYLREWLDGGHDTSPMTNLRLPHTDLVPNRALRSAIQEWLQHPS